MDVAYGRALEVQMLSAAGLEEELATRLQKSDPQLVTASTRQLVALAGLRNEGGILADKAVIRDVAVLDVFSVLRQAPQRLFAGEAALPVPELPVPELLELCRPILRGGPSVEKTIRAKAELSQDEDGRRVLRFEIPVLPSDVGRLEGVFYAAQGREFWIKDGASNFRGYTFAVPDEHELGRIEGGLG